MEKYSVFDCSIVELNRHHSDRKGNLTVVQNGDTLPFDVKGFTTFTTCRAARNGVHMPTAH